MKFQPVGNLNLYFPGHDSANVSNYYRDLDLEKAIAHTSYTVNGVTFTRETFASFANNVIVVRLTADKPGSITFTASQTTQHQPSNVVAKGSDEIVLTGTTSTHENVPGMIKFQSITKIKMKGDRLQQPIILSVSLRLMLLLFSLPLPRIISTIMTFRLMNQNVAMIF